MRKAGNRVRITAQLIDATTERNLWARTYDHEFKDIFNLQDKIAQQIVAALHIKSRDAEQARAWRVPTENLTAYDFLLRGLSHFSGLTKVDYAEARVMFERAIELDPRFASAYVLLGYAHLMDNAFGSSKDPRTLQKASELARKALTLDDSSAKAHALLADVHRASGRYDQAISQAERALSLNSSDPAAYRSMGNALNSIGKSEEAIRTIKKAIYLDPHHSVYYNTDLASAYRNLGRYDEATAVLEEALAQNPDWIPAYFELAMNYCQSWGVMQKEDPLMLDRALEAAEELLADDDSSVYAYFALSLVELLNKKHKEAIANAEKLAVLAPERADGYALLATIFLSMGRAGEAIEMVEKAMQLHPSLPAWYLNTYASAQSLSGRQTEALATHKKVFDHHPSHAEAFRAHVGLAILYDRLGQGKDAQTEAERILKLVPNFSVKIWGIRNPNIDQKRIEQDMAALRRAGLRR